jgi:hypothetical protein
MMLSFHTEAFEVSEEVYKTYPAVLRLDVMVSRLQDPAVARRLLAATLSALKTAGAKGVHTKVNRQDSFMLEFYAKLGFFAFQENEAPSDSVYMGRLL